MTDSKNAGVESSEEEIEIPEQPVEETADGSTGNGGM